MGKYNPRAPYIIGEEWVPIRDEDVTFSPAVNVVEIGHGFTLTSSKQVNHGRYYINSYPESEVLSQVYAMNIYPAGREHLTGPIRRTIIPVNAGAITGTFVGGTSNIPLSLHSPSDSNYITVDPDDSATSKTLDLYFAVNNQSTVLGGKRIVAVNLLHLLTWDPIKVTSGETADVNVDFTSSQEITVRATGIASGAQRVMELTPAISDGGPRALAMSPVIGTPGQSTALQRIAIGEANRLWSPTIGTATPEALPWRFEELQRFEVSAGLNRLAVHYDFGGSNSWAGTYYLAYAALEVLYCEETRVAVGGTAVYLGTNSVSYQLGANLITLRDLNFNANPILPAGDYVVTLSAPNVGDIRGPAASGRTKPATANGYPLVNGLREIYAMPAHPGIQVNVTQEEGETFTKEDVVVLPQLSLHASGNDCLVEVHSYGRLAAAQVWGSIVAEQILDRTVASGSYPWVRFYARRWGDTTVSLLLSEVGGAGATVTVTPSELDALDEIVDGWREVTKEWSTPPSASTFRFTASGELPGNRWEVLGVSAPALSGFTGTASPFTQVPSAQRLGPATYGAPVSGSSFAATWAPGYAPPASGAALDSTTDLVLMISQDAPAISGFTVTGATQTLAGIGQDCGIDPCGIPTGINYNLISWTSVSSQIPASGFGYYEIQRKDSIDTDWQTIMKGTQVTGTSFKDYEARIGIPTTYRMRSANVLEFVGDWSSEVSITTVAPGVSGSCLDNGHILVFTTNERQDGSSNLAYSTAWESGRVEEEFTFPEAGWTQFQAMYNRDFVTAFRPLERGGAQFSRNLLVQAAAISAPTLPGFQSLSDMAWDDVSYICVRDEDGNRWFANVLVPRGRVSRSRRLYMAPVTVTEVTDTPSPVDPWS